MPEILLYNEDIIVLGPPENIVVQTDLGPSGSRGSQIFVSNGDPNIVGIGQTPLLNDLCINIAAGTNYTDLYQYVAEPSGNTWIKLFKIQDAGAPVYEDEYVGSFTVSFTNGEGVIQIPLSSIAQSFPSNLTKSNFSVQMSIEADAKNEPPISFSYYVRPLENPATDLYIDIFAKQQPDEQYPFEMPLNLSKKVNIAVWLVGA